MLAFQSIFHYYSWRCLLRHLLLLLSSPISLSLCQRWHFGTCCCIHTIVLFLYLPSLLKITPVLTTTHNLMHFLICSTNCVFILCSMFLQTRVPMYIKNSISLSSIDTINSHIPILSITPEGVSKPVSDRTYAQLLSTAWRLKYNIFSFEFRRHWLYLHKMIAPLIPYTVIFMSVFVAKTRAETSRGLQRWMTFFVETGTK